MVGWWVSAESYWKTAWNPFCTCVTVKGSWKNGCTSSRTLPSPILHDNLWSKIQNMSVNWLVRDQATVEPIYSEIFAYTEASAWTPLTMLCNSGLEISYDTGAFNLLDYMLPKVLALLNRIHTFIHSFSGAPCGAFQQPVYNKCKVRKLRVLARPL